MSSGQLTEEQVERLLQLRHRESGDPHLDRMMRGVVDEKLGLAPAVGSHRDPRDSLACEHGLELFGIQKSQTYEGDGK
jgi:hypothetical protein